MQEKAASVRAANWVAHFPMTPQLAGGFPPHHLPVYKEAVESAAQLDSREERVQEEMVSSQVSPCCLLFEIAFPCERSPEIQKCSFLFVNRYEDQYKMQDSIICICQPEICWRESIVLLRRAISFAICILAHRT